MALLLSHVKITLNSQVVPRIDEFIFGWKKRKQISSKYEVKQFGLTVLTYVKRIVDQTYVLVVYVEIHLKDLLHFFAKKLNYYYRLLNSHLSNSEENCNCVQGCKKRFTSELRI